MTRRRLRSGLRLAGAALLIASVLDMGGPGGPAGPASAASAPPGDLFTIGRLRYRGGGDWYGDSSSLANLLRALRDRHGWKTAMEEEVVEPDDESLFNYPFLFMTGHGRVVFNEEEAARLRRHLDSGGFLWADDDYGLDETFRTAIRKVFPEDELVELPFDHPIYRQPYQFPNGLPKIHEHDNKSPKGYGIIRGGRLVLFYTFETDIGDGMENEDVHHDPADKREEALRMGVNIAHYALTH